MPTSGSASPFGIPQHPFADEEKSADTPECTTSQTASRGFFLIRETTVRRGNPRNPGDL
jgi:hypothetical protein